jgi:hypothetical protein
VCKLTEKELQEGFDAVYEDLYCELAKFGHLLELHVSVILRGPSACAYSLPRFVTTSVTILLGMFMPVMSGKQKLKPQ